MKRTEEVIARRTTFDNVRIELWSNGALTGTLGYALPGVPIARPKTTDAREIALRAGWLVLGEASLWNANELPALYAAARAVAARGGSPGDLRKAMRRPDESPPRRVTAPTSHRPDESSRAPATIPVRWEVLETANDGTVRVRVGYLPRLLFPSTGLWHERGNYEVMYQQSNGSWLGSGVTFKTLGETLRWLVDNRPQVVRSR